MYSTRATKSGTHCPPHLTHSFICILMVCCECVGPKYICICAIQETNGERCVYYSPWADLLAGPRCDLQPVVSCPLQEQACMDGLWPRASCNGGWLTLCASQSPTVRPSMPSCPCPLLSCCGDPVKPRNARFPAPGVHGPCPRHFC